MSARALPRRTRSEVLAQRENGVMGGCCSRFADQTACDCLETALPDPAPEMGIEACFLADICANLHNAVPRLVYADWLMEQNEVDREEFWRWSAEKPITRPDVSDSGKTFWWWRCEPDWERAFLACWDIDADLFDHLSARGVYFNVAQRATYRSPKRAMLDLEAAWVRQATVTTTCASGS